MISPEFLLISIIVVLIPGTGVLYTVSTRLFLTSRASIAAAIGCTAEIVPHLLASIFGLATILHMSAKAFQLFKLSGALYLFYMAWSIWHEAGGLQFERPSAKADYRTLVMRGFLINILNPKLSIFFLAFLSQFVSTDKGSALFQMLTLSFVFMAITLVIFVLYGLSAYKVRNMVVKSPSTLRWLQRSFASALTFLGIKLALADS